MKAIESSVIHKKEDEPPNSNYGPKGPELGPTDPAEKSWLADFISLSSFSFFKFNHRKWCLRLRFTLVKHIVGMTITFGHIRKERNCKPDKE